MNTCLFILIPTDGTLENLRERLRDCVAAIPDFPEAASAIAPMVAKDAPRSFWTMFLPNPMPTTED